MFYTASWPHIHTHVYLHTKTADTNIRHTTLIINPGKEGGVGNVCKPKFRRQEEWTSIIPSAIFLQLPFNNNSNSSRHKHINVGLFLSSLSSPERHCVWEVSQVPLSMDVEPSVPDTCAKGSGHCQGQTELDESQWDWKVLISQSRDYSSIQAWVN